MHKKSPRNFRLTSVLRSIVGIVSAMLVFCSVSAQGQIDWPTLGFSQFVTFTFFHPTSIAHPGDGSGRLFVVEQNGRIWIIQNNQVLIQPFLNIASEVQNAGAEQGLLGMAFAPNFSTNGYFYVSYTSTNQNALVISRFNVSSNANLADAASEQVILTVPKPYANHNGGQIAFGPDGYLYIGIGDGGSEGDPQNFGQTTGSLLGKLLRINAGGGGSPYTVPTNNPFVGNPAFAPEIWSYGLRNPWKFSFDRVTGDLYIGDVGQNLFEEIDFQQAGSAGGQNYGWRIMEAATNYNVPSGFTNFAALASPITWYDHRMLPTDAAGCVIGGFVYRGPHLPRFDGMYFYADFVAGWFWGLKWSGTNWQTQPLSSPKTASHYSPSTFGEDDAGNIYFADYYDGRIYQLQDSAATWTPTFSPPGATNDGNNVVAPIATPTATVTTLTSGATIHYTTNGIDPTEADPVTMGTISVTLHVTNKARAFRADLAPSGVAVAVYTKFQAGTPAITPGAGPIASNTTVTISTVTPAATIYYTLNGAIPTTNSLVYTNPLVLTGPAHLIAMAVASGYSNSSLANISYSAATVATPLFFPASGPISNGTTISIVCTTSNATVYYTLDGSTPTTNSPVYSGPFTINGGTTVKAIGVRPGFINSAVQSTLYQLPQVATPVFTPGTGPITNHTTITMSCNTPNSTIRYTVDGSPPTSSSAVYSQPIIINGGTTVTAYASADQYRDSLTKVVFYQLVQTATPVFTPNSGPIVDGTTITIFCATPGSTIYYTVDGSSPTTNSFVYTGPVALAGNTTLSAIAVTPEHLDSDVQSTLFDRAKVVAPVFTPPQGPLTNGTQVSITTTTAGATILYTQDGSNPDTNGSATVYSAPFQFSNVPVTLMARAFATGMDSSDISTTYFPLVEYENTVVTTFAGSPASGFTNGVGAGAAFVHPQGLCLDTNGNLLVADTDNNVIRKITPDGTTSTFAGTGVPGFHLGPAATAQFYRPLSVGVDSKNAAFVSDGSTSNYVYKIDTAGTMTLFAVTHAWVNQSCQWQLHLDAFDNVYIGVRGHIVKILPTGTTSIVAGPECGTFCPPWSLLVAAVPDANTNIFVATYGAILKVIPGPAVQQFSGPPFGFTDGPHELSQFITPEDVCIDGANNVLVSDLYRIRRVRSDGRVVTVAGNGAIGYANGRGSSAKFGGTTGICVDKNGNIFVSDTDNHCIRKISPDSAGIGIADDWQLAHFGYVGIDPNGDPDHDRMSNFAEFWAGTDPNNGTSLLAIDRSSFITNGVAQIRWKTMVGKVYSLQSSPDLITWTNVGSPVKGNGDLVFVNDSAVQNGTLYYRIAVVGL